MTGNPLELFRKFFGAVRAIFWLWGSFLAPNLRRFLGNNLARQNITSKTKYPCVVFMLVFKGVLGGSLEITSENNYHFWGERKPQKILLESGEKTPHPQDFSLTKKTARFTKGRFRPY